MSETERETMVQLRSMVAGTVEDLRRLADGEWPADMDRDEYDPEESPVFAWLTEQLETVLIGRQTVGTHDEWTTTAVEVLCCYGGPSLRVTFDLSSGWAEVRGSWWDDEAIERVYVAGLAEELADLVGVE